ncbi:nitrous oxide reductase accessory protein NosL [Bacillus sp. JJ1609]|uniref:nitrous oxide reductase accessory protein NosL n=1 Tax=Bacillus sp. JJ1609 TaxID=3122977 RepID=UPI002FFF2E39
MKKYLSILIALFLLTVISACGNDAAETKDESGGKTASATEEKHNETEHADGPHEPGEDDVCAFCNMKVYPENDPMGVFTAQAKTADGKYVFFDDSGCLLNSPRRDDVEYDEKWVRDYVTSEWIDADTAIPVKADIKTPMKYGYAFFKDQASAEKFIAENSDKKPELATWEQIDQISNERYMKKMKMKMNGGSMNKKENSDMNGEDSSMDGDHNEMEAEDKESGH